ncbi:hypothetical protein HELRODRAFT_65329, partial [Helobdella robusta]|uniref:EGF-like domain-containing protein n=1 Tax=Helobdella robusta TaxID=6412 RepID=T1FY64_HELRO
PIESCQDVTCYNGGQCLYEWNAYTCNCDMTSFSGPACDDGDNIINNDINNNNNDINNRNYYNNNDNLGLITITFSDSERADTTQDSFGLGFVSRQSRDEIATLARIISGNSNDYLQNRLSILPQRNGYIFVVYNLGTADHSIGDTSNVVNDDKYHVIRFNRVGPNSTLQVDNRPIVTKYPTGDYSNEDGGRKR